MSVYRIWLAIGCFIVLSGCSKPSCESLVKEYEVRKGNDESWLQEPYFVGLPKRCHEFYKAQN